MTRRAQQIRDRNARKDARITALREEKESLQKRLEAIIKIVDNEQKKGHALNSLTEIRDIARGGGVWIEYE
jgi:vacuolar-type H+-ATPase subunit I/STV1